MNFALKPDVAFAHRNALFAKRAATLRICTGRGAISSRTSAALKPVAGRRSSLRHVQPVSVSTQAITQASCGMMTWQHPNDCCDGTTIFRTTPSFLAPLLSDDEIAQQVRFTSYRFTSSTITFTGSAMHTTCSMPTVHPLYCPRMLTCVMSRDE
jgi:hypothetical protein